MNMKQTIQEKIKNHLSPLHLEVIDETHMHNVPSDAQSHFKVTIVSDEFKDLLPLARHRMVNAILKEELSGKIHALALHTMTPQEWYDKGGKAPESPECMGGGK